MKKIAFYDAKPYDKLWFDQYAKDYDFELKYFENRLTADTAILANGCDAVCAFVNDTIDAEAIGTLYQNGIGAIAMRCAGYNNVDFKAAWDKIHVMRVPAYSPYAVAEHAVALLLALNRKIHHAYNRTREGNFSLSGLIGFDLHGRTAGAVGTGKIGQIFIDICKGFGMEVVAYDPHPNEELDVDYVDFPDLCRVSDVISLHCPLTKETHHLVNKDSIAQMKDKVCIINTSRGALIDSAALVDGLKSGKIGSAGLDVYEEESDLFFEDFSNTVLQDDVLARLLSMPNVIITSHQAFLTEEALQNIARVTLENLSAYFKDQPLFNEICYQCKSMPSCDKFHNKRCF